MDGDTAAVEGALAAGCRFFAGYPITPATEIAERMAERLPEVGGRYIQMEDEIASMAAILGASCGGAKSMTATSGPGFSLMMENIGLGAMMEVPCVVVDVQRGGPSTGLPTLVGQQDMMQARWGSHGDYTIVAYCPSSPQEMFDVVIRAFNTAEKYRVPVLIMTDEGVGHMTEKVVIPTADKITAINRKEPTCPPAEYNTYRADKDLVPPMGIAGKGFKVRMTGLTHDERGRPATNAKAQDVLVKRLRDKIMLNTSEICVVEESQTDDAQVVVVSYGVTSRCVVRAVERARKEGIKAGSLRLVTVWPFPEEKVKQLAQRVKGFVVPEINLGQMVHEVERIAKNVPVISISNAGGTLPDEEETYLAIKKLAGA
jgi:2-oxoglutarate ferredoxin oxidoreductase subunit alpha